MKALAASREHENHHFRPLAVALIYLCAIAVAVVLCVSNASAQSPKKKDDPKLKPRPVSLKTKDGLKLRSYYFPSDKGKEAIPVLVVHEWQGQASPYVKMYLALREAGCAVLALEYRGHGGSREYVDLRGETKEFNLTTMSKTDVNKIILGDMEAAKAFLKEENNEGRLNLNAMVVVGVREGCVIGANWAARDWTFKPVGALKRGQDVKALVMVSPSKLVKGVSIDPVLANPMIMSLPIMVVSGSGGADAADADRIIKRIEVFKKRVGRGIAEGLEVETVKTSLSGPALVNEAPKVIPAIVNFILDQIKVSDEQHAWVERDS
jgi:pimeloyl-ACP methyl ester carboxylesterase